MALINPAVVEGARIVVRQTLSTLTSAASSTPQTQVTTTSAPTGTTSTGVPTSTTSAPTTTLPPANSGDNGGGPNGNNNGGGNSSSPLLFFVALGFGVVFTNLWIIVGVKYCFRYNARSRQMRMTEDGEPINMENMPRPHRRRREKKLMTMDEVNEKFPMLKYKTWVASRAQEGLPTRGGVTAPPSRANSVRDLDGVAPELPSKERMSTDDRPTTSVTIQPESKTKHHESKESTSSTMAAMPRASTESRSAPAVAEPTRQSKDLPRASHDEEDDDDEHINAALPPECMGTSGDTCAICIDTLEDDDDVRGLTCGHAFHAVCLDPWLTSRRACCPLCKADYYTPKPRPPPADHGDGTTTVITVSLPGDGRSGRMNMPSRPRNALFNIRRPSRTSTTTHYVSHHRSSRPSPTGRRPFFSRSSPANSAAASAGSSAQPGDQSPSNRAGVGSFFSNIRAMLPRRQSSTTRNGGAPAAVTASNLEAGVRNPTS